MTTHVHKDSHPLRRFVFRPGVFVQSHGTWERPIRVWLYRGAWRATCMPCLTGISSDDPEYGYGWPTQQAAFAAAMAHCGGCTNTKAEVA